MDILQLRKAGSWNFLSCLSAKRRPVGVPKETFPCGSLNFLDILGNGEDTAPLPGKMLGSHFHSGLSMGKTLVYPDRINVNVNNEHNQLLNMMGSG
jgi:hypothetical protein